MNLQEIFEKFSESDQSECAEPLLTKMLHHQHTHVSSFSRLRRDFVSLLLKGGVNHVAENILSYLDGKSLCAAELVCKEWHQVISEGKLWKKLIERRVRNDSLWMRLMERRGYIKYLFKPSTDESHPNHTLYRRLYRKIIQDIENIETNWQSIRRHIPKIIRSQSENSFEESLYARCVQYDDHKIVCGSCDSTIKFWDRNTLECIQVLTGHTDPVMCFQFNDRVLISGSLDSTVRVWDVKTGGIINTIHHGSEVLNLRFNNGRMVTSSRDPSVTVWNMVSPSEITIQSVLVGHTDAVTAFDLDGKYIVTASFDTTIKVWNTTTCELVRTLEGHTGEVQCLQYRDRLVVSGSEDKTIKIWDIESGACLRTLEGHKHGVANVKFDKKRIVSGTFDGDIKVWNLTAALDSLSSAEILSHETSVLSHFGVISLQFDDFQIVIGSMDSIWIFDFLNDTPSETPAMNIWQV